MGEIAPLIGLSTYLVSYPFICLRWLITNKEKLHEKEALDKCGKMYMGIATYRKNSAILYYPMFIFRRLAFVMYAHFFKDHQVFQIQFLVFSSSVYLIWYGSISPYISRRATIVETFNEFMFLCFTYHLFIFSKWTEPVERLPYGYTYLGCMVIMLFVNIVNVVINTV